jgi:hypothetical protein
VNLLFVFPESRPKFRPQGAIFIFLKKSRGEKIPPDTKSRVDRHTQNHFVTKLRAPNSRRPKISPGKITSDRGFPMKKNSRENLAKIPQNIAENKVVIGLVFFSLDSHEAMTDLFYLMNNLVDQHGKILIPGIYDDVLPVTDEERALYKDIDFDWDEFRCNVGCDKLIHGENKVRLKTRNNCNNFVSLAS